MKKLFLRDLSSISLQHTLKLITALLPLKDSKGILVYSTSFLLFIVLQFKIQLISFPYSTKGHFNTKPPTIYYITQLCSSFWASLVGHMNHSNQLVFPENNFPYYQEQLILVEKKVFFSCFSLLIIILTHENYNVKDTKID